MSCPALLEFDLQLLKVAPLHTIAAQFYHAFYKNEWRGADDWDLRALSISDAYEVQRLIAEQRVEAGERIVGYKVGCTSAAIQAQFGLDEPICGRLFAPHVQEEGARLDWSSYANCAIEPEMVLKIGRDVQGNDLSDQELLDSIDFVSPGIEIHNFKFWQGTPTIQELICSGGIHAGLIIGKSKIAPQTLDFRDEVFSVYTNDEIVTSAPASEIMEGPLHSLRWLVNFLTARGESLKKGAWIIPGSPTELIEINRDTELKVVIDRVGSVVARFEKPPS